MSDTDTLKARIEKLEQDLRRLHGKIDGERATQAEADAQRLRDALKDLLGAIERECDVIRAHEPRPIQEAAKLIYAGLSGERMRARAALHGKEGT